jgi:hypothetical protein
LVASLSAIVQVGYYKEFGGAKDTLQRVTFRFACLQSWFPSALLRDCSVCFH